MTKPVDHDDVEDGTDDYFVQARGWAIDSRAQASRSRRAAWIITGIAVVVALFEAVALMLLTPLKTVQPVTILVDRQTGYVQALDPQAPRRVSADAALTQSFLAQYVTAREGFDRSIAAIDYRKVALWSADRARSDYVGMMPATNPASPFQRYPAGSVVAVRVKSVSRLSASTALVRFDTQRQDRNGRTEPAQPWISVVRYRYVDAPMTMEDRLVNPLGFQVWSYRRDAEAAPLPVSRSQAAVSQPPAVVAEAISPPQLVASSAPTSTRPVSLVRRITERPTVRREIPINQLPMGSPLVGNQP